MLILDQIATKIIKEQELVIGPLAWSEAEKVPGLHLIGHDHGEIDASVTDKNAVIDRLVNQYERLFGKASHEVCKEAVATIVAEMDADEIPVSLKI